MLRIQFRAVVDTNTNELSSVNGLHGFENVIEVDVVFQISFVVTAHRSILFKDLKFWIGVVKDDDTCHTFFQ